MEEQEGSPPTPVEPRPRSRQQPRPLTPPYSPSSSRPPVPPYSPTQARSPHGPSPLSPNASSQPPVSPYSPRHNPDDLPTRLPPPPGSAARNTYVVQVQRDQIYRVPPPENARLVERYLSPTKDSSTSCGGPRRKCIIWTFSILFLLLILVGVIALIIFAVARPRNPVFSVEGFSMKSNNKAAPKEFDVRLSVSNPSGQTDYSFLKGGSAVLSHRGTNIATGKPPAFSQKHGADAATVAAVLKGSSLQKNKLPAGKGVPVMLSMRYPISARIAGFQAWHKEAAVDCDLKLTISATGSSTVLSQECHVRLQ